ncbi:hypothetical protein QQS21_012191 [Conoideocrella luteorostrata]|uniref:Uncharacterized protein n=1 Tax=Conoideocrella luteorostrata TaxID=1105319 RepID=A0AAJ0CBN0_9HYPO|nr:hypothetical protein QQS21_012191 [Conoideocrella luteorostrata]
MISTRGLVAGGNWLLLLSIASVANAVVYTVTTNIILTVSLYTYTNRYADSTSTITSTYRGSMAVKLKPSVTASPYSTRAITTTYGNGYGDLDDSDLVVLYRYFSPGAIATSDIAISTRTYSQTDFTSTVFYQTIEYTAPTSCPTPFTVTTSSFARVPSGAEDQVSIASATTSISTYNPRGGEYNDITYAPTTYTMVTAFMASTAHPTGSLATLNFVYSYYLTSCRNPGSSRTTRIGPRPTSGGGGRFDDSGDSNAFFDQPSCPWSNCGDYPYWGIILLTVLPGIFLLGFAESYFWFRRLMMGQSALRVGTVSWILLCLPLVFLTRRIPARSTEDQQDLRTQWKEKKLSQSLGLWLSWGFRYRYPMELLGAHPNYTYGDPVADEKLTEDWYGPNGDTPQVPASYIPQTVQPMASTTTDEQAPRLPPRPRATPTVSRPVSSVSPLSAVPEETSPQAVTDKSVVQKAAVTEEEMDPQVGRAPREEAEEDSEIKASGTDNKTTPPKNGSS